MVIELLNGNAYVIDSKTLLRLTKAWFKVVEFLSKKEEGTSHPKKRQEGRRLQ